jgi:hypothetical protein
MSPCARVQGARTGRVGAERSPPPGGATARGDHGRTVAAVTIVPSRILRVSPPIALAALLLAGCSSDTPTGPGDTPTICADYRHALDDPNKSPEQATLNAEILKSYDGTGDPTKQEAARRAWATAYATGIRPLAERATDPAVKTAFTDLADAFASGKTDLFKEIDAVVQVCPGPTDTPS